MTAGQAGQVPRPDTDRSLDNAIAEVEREIALRGNVYPRLVAQGKLRQGEADEHLARLRAAHGILLWLGENRAAIANALWPMAEARP